MPAVKALTSAVSSAPGIHLTAACGTAAGLVTACAHLTPAEAAALWSAVTVVSGAAAGLLRRPAHVALTVTAVTTVIGDLAVLNVHVPPSWQAAALSLASLAGGAVTEAARPQQDPPAASPGRHAGPQGG